jgi:hypothetical protein
MPRVFSSQPIEKLLEFFEGTDPTGRVAGIRLEPNHRLQCGTELFDFTAFGP